MKSGLTHIDVGPELTRTEWESEETHALINGSSFPAAPVERQLFYRNDLHLWYIYNGTTWEPLQSTAQIEGHRQTEVHVLDQPPAAHDNAKHSTAYTAEAAFNNHSARHELGGADVLSLAGLSGELADDQPPKSHDNTKHTTNYASDHDLSTHVGTEAAPVHGSTSAATVEKLIHRDNQGRARVAPPSHADDIDTFGARVAGIGVHKAAEVHDLDQPPESHDNTKHSTNYATEAAFNNHSARHELGGADVISVAGLSGELADDQPPKSHDNTKHTPNMAEEAAFLAHSSRHEWLAADEFNPKDLIMATVGVLRILAMSSFDGLAETKTGSASTEANFTNWRFVTGATQGSVAARLCTHADWFQHTSPSWRWRFFARISPRTTGLGHKSFVGYFSNVTAPFTLATQNHVVFEIDADGKIYACSGDGVNSVRTDTGVTVGAGGGSYDCYFKYMQNDIKFYIGGILKATHTTHRPTSASLRLGVHHSNPDDAATRDLWIWACRIMAADE